MATESLSPDPGQGTEEQKVECPVCGRPMRFHVSADRDWWGCSGYPECDTQQSAGSDGLPLGIPGDKETRQARMRAHDVFDPIWERSVEFYGRESNSQSRGRLLTIARSRAYLWLADRLGMTRDECHIARMDVFHCDFVEQIWAGVTYGTVRAWSRSKTVRRKEAKLVKRYGSQQHDLDLDVDKEFEKLRANHIRQLKRDMRI